MGQGEQRGQSFEHQPWCHSWPGWASVVSSLRRGGGCLSPRTSQVNEIAGAMYLVSSGPAVRVWPSLLAQIPPLGSRWHLTLEVPPVCSAVLRRGPAPREECGSQGCAKLKTELLPQKSPPTGQREALRPALPHRPSRKRPCTRRKLGWETALSQQMHEPDRTWALD